MKKYILILGLLFNVSTYAEVLTSGYCGRKDEEGNFGTNCEWRYEDGTLYVSGEGPTHTSIWVDYPWHTELSGSVEHIVVENGITDLGMHAFYNMNNVTDVSLPSSLEVISYNAFRNMGALTSLIIPDSVTKIHGDTNSYPFSSTLENLYCSAAQKKICENALEWSGLDKNVLKTYEKINGQYVYGGKFYNTLSDINTTKNIKKRIYTIDEANRVAGTKNRVSITYR